MYVLDPWPEGAGRSVRRGRSLRAVRPAISRGAPVFVRGVLRGSAELDGVGAGTGGACTSDSISVAVGGLGVRPQGGGGGKRSGKAGHGTGL